MNPYQALQHAVRRSDGICTMWEARREWTAYCEWIRKINPAKRIEVYTREEYQALCDRRKKRKPKSSRITLEDGKTEFEAKKEARAARKPKSDAAKPEQQPLMAGWVEDKASQMDRRLGLDLSEIDEFFRRMDDNGYHGSF